MTAQSVTARAGLFASCPTVTEKGTMPESGTNTEAQRGVFWDRERLDALVQEGWLRSQRHPEADLWIYNYTEKTQFESYWTPETLACRGLIRGHGLT